MTSAPLADYKKNVIKKIEGLRSVFAKAAVGDYSEKIKIPDNNDEFTELYTGIQIMIEVIRTKIKELEDANRNLKQKIKDLELLNTVTINRELKLIKLEKELALTTKKIRTLSKVKNRTADTKKIGSE